MEAYPAYNKFGNIKCFFFYYCHLCNAAVIAIAACSQCYILQYKDPPKNKPYLQGLALINACISLALTVSLQQKTVIQFRNSTSLSSKSKADSFQVSVTVFD